VSSIILSGQAPGEVNITYLSFTPMSNSTALFILDVDRVIFTTPSIIIGNAATLNTTTYIIVRGTYNEWNFYTRPLVEFARPPSVSNGATNNIDIATSIGVTGNIGVEFRVQQGVTLTFHNGTKISGDGTNTTIALHSYSSILVNSTSPSVASQLVDMAITLADYASIPIQLSLSSVTLELNGTTSHVIGTDDRDMIWLLNNVQVIGSNQNLKNIFVVGLIGTNRLTWTSDSITNPDTVRFINGDLQPTILIISTFVVSTSPTTLVWLNWGMTGSAISIQFGDECNYQGVITLVPNDSGPTLPDWMYAMFIPSSSRVNM
jgi:hypothetical protein